MTKFPLTNIHISFSRFPNSWTMLFAFKPLTTINFSIIPTKLSISMSEIIFELTFVISFLCYLNSFFFHIIFPNSFKLYWRINANSKTIFFIVFDLTKIQTFLIFKNYLEILWFYHTAKHYFFIHWLIRSNKLRNFQYILQNMDV